MKRILAAGAAALVVSGLALDAHAQRHPGGRGGEGSRDMASKRGEGEGPRSPAAAPEPLAALERELPSLQVDLMLKAEQVGSWRLFERDVRDLAEMERARRRQLMALRDPDAQHPATAATLIATLADADRRKADASADMRLHFDGLYGALDEIQRRMIDRRVLLSQTEPLGSEPAKK